MVQPASKDTELSSVILMSSEMVSSAVFPKESKTIASGEAMLSRIGAPPVVAPIARSLPAAQATCVKDRKSPAVMIKVFMTMIDCGCF